ncbi:caspase family protein [Paraburkholderia aspalathi]|uniref:Caspase domain-containing protein n=1 Tax=Paraburkholderia aspalathi TaxID=1324617 RepID=A0A1I7CLU8_9BURK|nr:caspase family protein [Paraburkholderia aspalathi]SFU00388.1 Caspase domain-containing protein [Paraburkholderia aspalathi]
MTRAAVLIGVNKTGNLPELNTAVKSARDMERWALAQGFAPSTVVVITDEGQPVTILRIFQAVKDLVARDTIDQLLVYFSGHGVNRNYCEYWLLSDAPEDGNAAVNVQASVDRAWNCGIPHIVLLSDACRTAAETIQAQGVVGGVIFPSFSGAASSSKVDIFFACRLGEPAAEVKNFDDSASQYQAVYTKVLLEALEGKFPDIVDEQGPLWFVRARRLGNFLEREVARRAYRKKVVQVPEARVTSDEKAWISQLTALPEVEAGYSAPLRDGFETAADVAFGTGPDIEDGGQGLGPPNRDDTSYLVEREEQPTFYEETAISISDLASLAVTYGLLEGNRKNLYQLLEHRADDSSQVTSFRQTLATLLTVWDRGGRPEIGCGFKISGANVKCALSISRIKVRGDIVEIKETPVAPVAVLLEFDDGTGAILPAVPGYLCSVVVSDGQIIAVTYEATRRHMAATSRSPTGDQRRLRAAIAASVRHGVFDIDRLDVGRLLTVCRRRGKIDVAIVLSTVYALNALGRHVDIESIKRAVLLQFGAVFFDFSFLTARATGEGAAIDAGTPMFPLMSHGWSLLAAHGEVASPLDTLQYHLAASVWTLFDALGVAQLRALFFKEMS